MSTRITYILGFTVIALLLMASAYLQVFDGIMPCPLCTLQRVSFALLGIIFLLGLFFHPFRVGRILISLLLAFVTLLGILFSGRQIWLQHFPPASGSECGVSLQYMLQALPLSEALQKTFQGSAECSQNGWEFLHLSMPEWALAWFLLFLGLSIYLLLREKKNLS